MKSKFSNNRKAPRMRKGEFSKMVITNELFSRFKKEFPEYKEISWKEFFEIWLEIAAEIRYEAIWNPLGVRLGYHTGELKLQYLPYKLRTVDEKSSGDLGYEVPFINLTTKGKVPKIKWERRKAVKTNKILQFYAFDETRELNRLAFDYVNKHPEKIRVARNTLGGHSVWRQKMKSK